MIPRVIYQFSGVKTLGRLEVYITILAILSFYRSKMQSAKEQPLLALLWRNPLSNPPYGHLVWPDINLPRLA